MDITEKARELGLMLASSTQMETYKNAESAMLSDEKSTKLMSEYKQLQIEMVKRTRESAETEVIEDTKQKLLAKNKEITEYDITYDFLTSKTNLDALMKKVNDIIIFSISGESACSDDKCSSCGGGCKG